MRLFIAIDLPEEIKQSLADIKDSFDKDTGKIRWITKENLHITLKFLGEMNKDKQEEVTKILNKITFSPFTLHFSSFGVFPNSDKIRIFWTGLEPKDKLFDLHKIIDTSLSEHFPPNQNFLAHVTLARIKSLKDKETFLETIHKLKPPSLKTDINIKQFHLYESVLTPGGPVYTKLETFY